MKYDEIVQISYEWPVSCFQRINTTTAGAAGTLAHKHKPLSCSAVASAVCSTVQCNSLVTLLWTPKDFISKNTPGQEKVFADCRTQKTGLFTWSGFEGKHEFPTTPRALHLPLWQSSREPCSNLTLKFPFLAQGRLKCVWSSWILLHWAEPQALHARTWETLACFWSGHNENKWGLQFKVVTKNLFFPPF